MLGQSKHLHAQVVDKDFDNLQAIVHVESEVSNVVNVSLVDSVYRNEGSLVSENYDAAFAKIEVLNPHIFPIRLPTLGHVRLEK